MAALNEDNVPNDGVRVYTIGGVEVKFPHKAYPSQLSMMDKIIRCLTKKQNCLLESPTGSGKSLALLCSSLAWQRKFEKDLILLNDELEAQVRSNSEVGKTEISSPLNQSCCSNENSVNKVKTPTNDCLNNVINLNKFRFTGKSKYGITRPVFIDDDDDDFQPMAKTPNLGFSYLNEIETTFSQGRPTVMDHEFCNNGSQSSSTVDTPNVGSEINHMNVKEDLSLSESPELKQQVFVKKRPQIFFGTRTHKQISQIIRELKKTVYRDAKMTILSSRERTCIHPFVLSSDNKQEACSELIDHPVEPQCPFYRNHRKINHYNPSRLSDAWDIEDLVTKLASIKTCPYFSTRILVEKSDIIFCPYTYLIDPLTRSSLDITLNNNIIILDEAHNIEDVARESASWTVTHFQLFEAINNFSHVTPQCGEVSSNYYTVCNVLSAFYGWFFDNRSLLKRDTFDCATKVYSGAEMVAILDYIGVGPEKHESFEKNIKIILKQESDPEIEKDKLAGGTLFLLKSFIILLNFIYKDNFKYMSDYRCIFSEKQSNFFSPNSRIGKKALVSSSQTVQQSNRPILGLSMNFCCMNPAVAFSHIKDDIRTLVVTSGTLSPMFSFQSELDTPFNIMFEANHVISKSQMWVGTIGYGPSGSALSATYRNTELYTFQDEIGTLVLQICTVVPYGVLCFVPSYGMLDKLTTRWQNTGLWKCLESKKFIVCESKGAKVFDQSIAEYYNAVEESKYRSDINGALLIAVCRGKVSEGLDFADDYARAVITIGIPFPCLKETQVDLKRKYNDANRSRKKIISGNEWYETQAFRALNQALGRCIRHSNDYGALILIDERFQKQQRYVNLLSKWIRKEITHFNSTSSALDSLKQFSVEQCLRNNLENHISEMDVI